MQIVLEVLAIAIVYTLLVCALPRLVSGNPTSGWRAGIFSGVLMGIGIAPLHQSLSLNLFWLIVVIWLFILVFGYVLSMIEAVVFSDGPSPFGRREILGAVVVTGLLSGVVGAFSESGTGGTAPELISAYVDRIGFAALGMKIAFAAIAFMVAYCVIGSAVLPLVRPYYTDQSLGLNLRIPAPGVVIPLQLARGVIATIVMLPILLSCSAWGIEAWMLIGVAVGLTSGVVPCMNAPGWPIGLRAIHAIEIAVFSMVQSVAWCWLFIA